MMSSVSRIALGIAIMMLVACANKQVSLECDQHRAVCQKSCQERFKQCSEICDNSCYKCSAAASCSATRNYNRYKQEQYVQGGIIARELKSYRDPLQCRKTTCNCWADYNVCAQSCRGLIHKRLQVGPACC